jgi:hypothetical protein
MYASIEKLKKLHRDGQLCLFVGAGISRRAAFQTGMICRRWS